MFECYAVLQVAASSAAEPASLAAAATYESANRQMTVTSQVSGFPASQGTRDRPSGRFPSDQLRPSGSLVHGMPAETIARATKSFRAWCLASLPGAFLQTKPCSPCVSTRAPQCRADLEHDTLATLRFRYGCSAMLTLASH